PSWAGQTATGSNLNRPRKQCVFIADLCNKAMRNTEGHVGFGFGIHFCLGAQVARLEAKAALEGLLRRFPRLSRTDAAIPRVESAVVRGPKALPLVVG
ncbi:MAG: cytochrome P450, partial [Candidatus Binatia bacterium]